VLEAETGQGQPTPTYGSAGSGSYAAPPPAQADPSNGLSTAPSAAPSTGGTPVVEKPPAVAPSGPPELSSSKINVRGQSRSIGYFLFGASITAIVVSLLVMGMKSQKAAAIGQLQREYDSEIQTRLSDKIFQDQEKKVKEIGGQVTVLKSALADRVMFSKFFTELEKVTYKKARFTNIAASKENVVTLTGTVADFVDLSKTILALKTSTVFQEVDLTSVEVDKEKNTINFSVQIKLDPSLLKIEGVKSQATETAATAGGTTASSSEPTANISTTDTVVPSSSP
jgi:Tfp pilus assembly protein PilN